MIGSESDENDDIEDDRCGIISYDPTTRLLMAFLIIQYFIEHEVVLKEDSGNCLEQTCLLCCVKWLKPQHSWFGNSVIVTQCLEAAESPMRYMPVQHIPCRCAYMSTQLQFSRNTEDVTIAIPIVRNFSIF